jgi:hypothetical protein|tara:strand:- start:64 stop:270 length:207 start_codon:yes stop_codon:yes gene_type:complete
MITCTFKLTNREKSFVGANTKECYKKFLNDYEEAIDEIKVVYVVGGPQGGTYTAEQFRSQINSHLFKR